MPTILIIEDDAGISGLINRILVAEGHTVMEAGNGIDAQQILACNPVNLVITDIFMPQQDGIGAIIDIREQYPDIKIIAISGGGRTDEVDFLELAQNLGAQRIIKKPFGHSELLGAVRELL